MTFYAWVEGWDERPVSSGVRHSRCCILCMADPFHFEPYVHLAGLTDHSALISWGGFFFQPGARGGTAELAGAADDDAWMVMDDEALSAVDGGRTESIGERSRPYGRAEVAILDTGGRIVAEAQTSSTNHVWIGGLEPGTEYRYRITVNGRDWLAGQRFDWGGQSTVPGLRRSGRKYVAAFRTHPRPDSVEPVCFAVLGDFGIGIRTDHDDARRQRLIARGLEQAVDRFGVHLVLTTGDNIYLGQEHTTATGAEDDDWFFTFYQPYRYLLDRLPFYPAVGNHDAADTEESDDREQLDDNYYLRQRFTEKREATRASVDPGLFYAFDVGAMARFVCIDSTRGDGADGRRFFEHPRHLEFIENSLSRPDGRPRWCIPFSHHPTYCAGPRHDNTHEMVETLAPRFARSGVRLVLAGHEHNFQYSLDEGVHYVLSGAGGKLRPDRPGGFSEARTVAWAAAAHFLVVEVSEERTVVHPLGCDEHGEVHPIDIVTPAGEPYPVPIVIER